MNLLSDANVCQLPSSAIHCGAGRVLRQWGICALTLVLAGCGAETEVLRGIEHDLGIVLTSADPDARVEHRFKIRNPYDSPLRVKVTGVSCGCTEATLDREVIAPGGEASLDMSVSAANANKDEEMHVLVTTDSETSPELKYVLKWSSRARVFSQLGGPLKFQVEPGETVRKKISLKYHQPTTETPQEAFVRTRGDGVEVRLLRVVDESTEGDLRTWRIDAEVSARVGKSTMKRMELVWLESGYGDYKIEQPIWIQPVLAVRAIPSEVFIRGDADGMSGEIRLESDSRFRILALRVDSNRLVIEPEFPADEQLSHRVRFSLSNVEQSGEFLETQLIIKTDHPQQSELRVPMYAIAKNSKSDGS